MSFLGLFYLPLGGFVLRNSVFSQCLVYKLAVFYVSCSSKKISLLFIFSPVPHIESQSVVFFPFPIAVLKIGRDGRGRKIEAKNDAGDEAEPPVSCQLHTSTQHMP